MAKEQPEKTEQAAPGKGVSIQLVPAAGSEQPIFANLTTVQPSDGFALVDFGFVEPGALAALSRLAGSGKKMPERLTGRLAARVALSYGSLAALHRQLGGVLQALAKASQTRAAEKPKPS
jgi:hypothetical protein